MELIKSVAASEVDQRQDSAKLSSKRELDQRTRQTERSGRVDDIEAIENMDLLHDKIFKKLHNVEKESKRSLPPRSPALDKQIKAARSQRREAQRSLL